MFVDSTLAALEEAFRTGAVRVILAGIKGDIQLGEFTRREWPDSTIVEAEVKAGRVSGATWEQIEEQRKDIGRLDEVLGLAQGDTHVIIASCPEVHMDAIDAQCADRSNVHLSFARNGEQFVSWAPLNQPGHWDIMVSYTQRNAKAQLLAAEIYSGMLERGKTWMDVRMDQLNEAAMREAAQHSKIIVAVVTGRVSQRKMLTFVLSTDLTWRRWTIPWRARTLPASTACKSSAGLARWAFLPASHSGRGQVSIGEFIDQAPPDLRDLVGSVDFQTMVRVSPSHWKLSMDELVAKLEDMVQP